MTHAVYPGSFDPPTLGHIDVVNRAARLFSRVTIAVLINPDKAALFEAAQRVEMLRQATNELENVTSHTFEGLLVDFCRRQQADVIVKGLRSPADFNYELPMAQMNTGLSGIETIFLATSSQYSHISSSLVKQIARYGGDVAKLLPAGVAEQVAAKFSNR